MSTHIYTGSDSKKIDQLAIAEYGYKGLDLMTLAGQLAFKHVQKHLGNMNGQPKSMLVICGSGNNGGDGYVVAHCALRAGWTVSLFACAPPKTADASAVSARFLKAGGQVFSSLENILKSDPVAVVVDALLGVGITGILREPYVAAIQLMNQLSGFKVAIDVPSGIDADTGYAHAPAFRADLTVTYIVPKLGLLTGESLNYVGTLMVENLNIKPEVIERIPECATLLSSPVFKKRPVNSHKGVFGHVVIAGGCDGMLGATLLAGNAALRCGSGKVHIMSTERHLDSPALYCPELMSVVFEKHNNGVLQEADVLVLGPGLGLNSWGQQVFDVVIQSNQPLVIDADALTMLAKTELRSKDENWVLTPHPGEAARLLGISTANVQADRLTAVQTIAQQYNCICVLKGAGTLISDSKSNTSLCDIGNSGMATAGMGDVLSGMIASFIGQGMTLLSASKAAVWLHAYTADLFTESQAPASLIASDIIDYLPTSLNTVHTTKSA